MAARSAIALVAVLTAVANLMFGWGWLVALGAAVAVLAAGELAGHLLARRQPAAAAAPAPATGYGPLSRREVEVAVLVAGGLTNKEIARRLYIGEKTVERHLDNINHRLDIHSRVQLTNWMRDRGLELRAADGDPMRTSPDS